MLAADEQIAGRRITRSAAAQHRLLLGGQRERRRLQKGESGDYRRHKHFCWRQAADSERCTPIVNCRQPSACDRARPSLVLAAHSRQRRRR